MPLHFEHTYARTSPRFYARVDPTPVARPTLLCVNRSLAELLGTSAEELSSQEWVAALAGQGVPAGAEPVALVYAGHQFGGFVPQLGDGRAILLGEVLGRDGVRYDVQLKGAGRTPYSRGGDGRAALGPVLREYVVSEAMAALGVPTTRALAAVATGEHVERTTRLPGAVLTRVAKSHLRVGTFQFFAARDDLASLRLLTDYALARHYPNAPRSDGPALALLDAVIEAQAELVAGWLALGFVHGVMNTDNTSIAGETIDYGPCAFLDAYEPQRTFSSIDRGGRYAFLSQPRMALWNLARLAEALLPLIDDDEERAVALATEHVERFAPRFDAAHGRVLRHKLGLTEHHDGDEELVSSLLDQLAGEHVDYTLFFRRLYALARGTDTTAARASFTDAAWFDTWALTWRARLARESASPDEQHERMRTSNPAFIPRNHRVEEMIAAATQADMAPFERLMRVLARPYDDQPDDADLAQPPGAEQWSYRTHCGT